MAAGCASKESEATETTAEGLSAAVESKGGLLAMPSRSVLTAAETGSSAGPGKAGAECR